MASWQVQDAKARFSEFLDAMLKKGPQVVTRRGVETAVLVPIAAAAKSGPAELEDLLLRAVPRFEAVVPERGRLRRNAG